MSGYEWQGSGQHGGFVRAGNRNRNVLGDAERGRRLWELLNAEPFWCDNCGCTHPLREHRICRAEHPYRTAVRGAS